MRQVIWCCTLPQYHGQRLNGRCSQSTWNLTPTNQPYSLAFRKKDMGLTYSTIIDGRRYLVTDTLAGDSLSKLLMQCRIDTKTPTAYMQLYNGSCAWLRGVNSERYVFIDLHNTTAWEGKYSFLYSEDPRSIYRPLATYWDEKTFFPVDQIIGESWKNGSSKSKDST